MFSIVLFIVALVTILFLIAFFGKAKKVGRNPWLWGAVGGVSFFVIFWVFAMATIIAIQSVMPPSPGTEALADSIGTGAGLVAGLWITNIVRRKFLNSSAVAADLKHSRRT